MANMMLFMMLIVACQASASHAVFNRKMLGGVEPPLVYGTTMQSGNQLIRGSGGGRESVIMNIAQSQAAQGRTDSVTTRVSNSINTGQLDADTRNHLGGSDAHGAIDSAAGDNSGAFSAAKENQGIVSVTKFGQGMDLSTDNRAALAYIDAQDAVKSSLNGGNTFMATESASNSAWEAASATKTHPTGR